MNTKLILTLGLSTLLASISADMLRQYPQALADYSKAIELDSKDAQAYLEKARTHYMLGQYPQALADCNKARDCKINCVKG